MDRGIPTEDSLATMRQADTPVHYLVGTPRGRLSKLEKAFLSLPWEQVRESVEVKLLEAEGRALHPGTQSRSGAQRTGHAPASAQTIVETTP